MIIGWILFALVLVAGALGWRRREWLVRRYLTDRGEVALPVGDVATARFVVREMDRTLHKSGAANEIIQHAPQLVRKLDRFAQVIGSCLSVDLLQRPSVTTDLILYFHATARANRTRIPLEASLNNARRRGYRVEPLTDDQVKEFLAWRQEETDEANDAGRKAGRKAATLRKVPGGGERDGRGLKIRPRKG